VRNIKKPHREGHRGNAKDAKLSESLRVLGIAFAIFAVFLAPRADAKPGDRGGKFFSLPRRLIAQ
jgi:hypothetical protein